MDCLFIPVAAVVVAALLKLVAGKDGDAGEEDPNALAETAKGWLFRNVYETLNSRMTATA